jgi:hypothetical protein
LAGKDALKCFSPKELNSESSKKVETAVLLCAAAGSALEISVSNVLAGAASLPAKSNQRDGPSTATSSVAGGFGYECSLISPFSKKPLEVRMGKGKGNPEYWVALVQPGTMLYEIQGVDEELAREAFRLAGAKLPVATSFVKRQAA